MFCYDDVDDDENDGFDSQRHKKFLNNEVSNSGILISLLIL